MTAGSVSVAVLLACGVAVLLLCCVGVLVMRTPFARLHYLGPAGSLGPLLIAAAVLVRHSSAQACIKMILIVLALLLINPVLTHATARAARIRQTGGLTIRGSASQEES